MIVGKTDTVAFCASDIPAVLDYTKDICALEDDQMAVLKPGSIELYDFFGDKVSMKWTHISYDACAAQKGVDMIRLCKKRCMNSHMSLKKR